MSSRPPSPSPLDALIESADPALGIEVPDATSLPAQALFDWIVDGEPDAPLRARRGGYGHVRRSGGSERVGRRARALPVLAAVAIVIGLLVVVGVIPSPLHSAPPAGASVLEQIAQNAGAQAPVTLGPDQYLHTTMDASFNVTVLPGQPSPPSPPAQASVNATLQSWVNSADTAYYENDFGPAQFASPGAQAAWQAAGLSVEPVLPQPDVGREVVQAVGGSPGSYTTGFSAFDVSSLPTDPASLGPLLAGGHTGIASLDALTPALAGGAAAAEFDRAVLLLLGPDVGSTPALVSALYRVLAGMPQVEVLGEIPDHSGRVGQGFSLETTLGAVTVVVDPATGSVLEVRGQPLPLPGEEFRVVHVYMSKSSGAAIRAVGDARVAWIDPAGSPQAVGVKSLPPGER